jgi:hypothetical protein
MLKRVILAEIRQYALPFLEKFSDVSAVREALESENPRDWFVLTGTQRTAKLAAIEFIQGRQPLAIARLDQTLRELREAPPKHRLPLEKLRDRMLAIKDDKKKEE